jgi:hypothetical protein
VKTKLVYAVLLFVLLLGGSSASLLARGFSGNCSGTYLMAEAGGATSLWTFEADGTFFATSSLQGILKFSDQQGSWEKDGNNGLKGVVLALVFDDPAHRPHLAVDLAQVGADRGHRHAEPQGDVLVAQSLPHEADDVDLPGG